MQVTTCMIANLRRHLFYMFAFIVLTSVFFSKKVLYFYKGEFYFDND